MTIGTSQDQAAMQRRSLRMKRRAKEVRQAMLARKMTLAEALNDPLLQAVSLGRMMRWQRRVGKALLPRILRGAGISHVWLTRPVGQLSDEAKNRLGAEAKRWGQPK